jgi:hypothetical protein
MSSEVFEMIWVTIAIVIWRFLMVSFSHIKAFSCFAVEVDQGMCFWQLKPLQMVVLLQASLVPLPSHLQLKQWVYEIEWCHMMDSSKSPKKPSFLITSLLKQVEVCDMLPTSTILHIILSSWVEAYLVTQTTETLIEKAIDDLPLCVWWNIQWVLHDSAYLIWTVLRTCAT